MEGGEAQPQVDVLRIERQRSLQVRLGILGLVQRDQPRRRRPWCQAAVVALTLGDAAQRILRDIHFYAQAGRRQREIEQRRGVARPQFLRALHPPNGREANAAAPRFGP